MTDAMMTAEKLLYANAVKLQPHEPFTWASGWKSPIYCDNRKLLSQPFIRDYVKSELSNTIFDKFPDAALIAGVATAGIAWGALVADQLKLPFVYVRSKPKEHGLGNQIEGEYQGGERTIVVEDLISTGGSSLQAVEALRSAGLDVGGVVSIFSYEFLQATEAFEKANVSCLSLTSYPVLLDLAAKNGSLSAGDKEILLKWRSDPSAWTGIL